MLEATGLGGFLMLRLIANLGESRKLATLFWIMYIYICILVCSCIYIYIYVIIIGGPLGLFKNVYLHHF